MFSVSLLIGAGALLAAHEILVARFRPGGRRAVTLVRVTLLVAALVAAAAFGARFPFQAVLEQVSPDQDDGVEEQEFIGDPILRGVLETQRPERPFPQNGAGEAVRGWQDSILSTMRIKAGFASPPTTVAMRVIETSDLGDVQRTFLEFTSWDGTRIPAFVHRPKGDGKRAGVLVIPGHGRGIRSTAGISAPDYQHAAALELAKRGYVTLTPELRGFGLLAPDGQPVHRAVAHAALASGTFYKAVVGRDLRAALTVLQQWEGVDGQRLGVVGTSLGGELAVFLAALDPRPQVVISHSYGGGTGPETVAAAATDRARQTPHGCHTIPGVNEILHREDWFRLLAPRAVQLVRGVDNSPRPEAVKTFETRVSQAFSALAAGDRFEFVIEPGEHEFFVEPAARFLARWL
jgi:dienelactone hydrolase